MILKNNVYICRKPLITRYMSKKLLIALLAAFALVAVSCDKTDGQGNGKNGKVSKSDFVGSWGQNGSVVYIFKDDGTYTEATWDTTIAGKWELKDNKLSFTPDDGEAWDTDFLLIGGKAWLVMISEFGEGAEKSRMFDNYRKTGATVDSGKLTDGRWDATHNGVKPESYEKDTDYTFCMIIKGKTVDLYVPVWGMHIQGQFTLSDGKMHIEADDDHIWQAAYKTGDSVSGSIGWNAWGCPDEDYANTWDDSYGAMNAETFELQSPYVWYTANQIKAMGEKPVPGDPKYENNKYMFKYMLYEYGESVSANAQDLCDFELCVAPGGKEAYGGAVGLSPCVYKR